MTSLNNTLEAARQTSRLTSEAHTGIPWVYAAMMHEAQVVEVENGLDA
jgi:hypothetical protein